LGQFSEVYKATRQWSSQDSSEVAVKTLKPGSGEGDKVTF